MMVEHTQQRETFGQKLSDRQAIQWWIADGATKLHAARLKVMDAAEKQDRGEDVRTVASMIKVFATEMATEVIDQAMQSFGAMGMTRELPFAIMSPRGERSFVDGVRPSAASDLEPEYSSFARELDFSGVAASCTAESSCGLFGWLADGAIGFGS